MVDAQEFQKLAGSFGRASGEYERGRPGYPDPAVEWLIPTDARDVLDLGAGTGKFTRSLAARGLSVVAVDPSDQMLAALTEASPDIVALVGTAEQIPLGGDSVDGVTVAQAWHWVDPERAVPEVARVLRPGGQLGLVWNQRDERVDWVQRLATIIHEDGSAETLAGSIVVGPPFGPIEAAEFLWQKPMDRPEMHAMIASRSVFITAEPTHQEQILTAVDELLDTHPDLVGRDVFAMPYRTFVFRTRLAG